MKKVYFLVFVLELIGKSRCYLMPITEKTPKPKFFVYYTAAFWRPLNLFFLAYTTSQKPCIPKYYEGNDGEKVLMNCVCNATYCDEMSPVGTLSPGQVAVYTSSMSGKRLERTNLNFGTSDSKLKKLEQKSNI